MSAMTSVAETAKAGINDVDEVVDAKTTTKSKYLSIGLSNLKDSR
jgi:hypothetical protein